MTLHALNSEPNLRRHQRPERRRAVCSTPPRRPILVATPNCLDGLAIERALRRAGHTVAGIASTADEAIRYVRAILPEVVLIDTRLPGVRDGVTAAIEIHRKFGTPIIFLAGAIDADQGSRGGCMRAWMDREAHQSAHNRKPDRPPQVMRSHKASED